MNEFKKRLRNKLSHAFPKQTISQDSFGDIWVKVGEQETIEEALEYFSKTVDQLLDVSLPPERTRIFFYKKDMAIYTKYIINPATYDLS